MPMSEVRESIEIAAPPDAVWALALDPARLADWVTIHRSLGDVDPGPPRAGMRMDQTLTLRGAPFRVRWTLVVCEPPDRAEWHGLGPAGSRAQTSYELEPAGNGTRFSYINVFYTPLGLIGRMAQRAVAGHLPQNEARASLARLKALCETH
ncbi:unannotated protein [freshwater metagenome]|uniref:Unannotated protein n=1 Tax=freshwater metagenome TaxID=449393 RepID=A0A6J7DC22_9ZZZZ